jgi:sugar lactone lactonase YvrE
VTDRSAVRVRLIADTRASIGETPVWRADSVTWPAPVERSIHQVMLSCSAPPAIHSRVMERAIFALAVHSDGMLRGTLEDRFAVIMDDGEVIGGPPASLPPGCRLNDMAIDHRGGLWAGSMHRGALATRGGLWFAPDLETPPRCVAEGLGVANGMDFSADGTQLLVIDTLARTLLAYPLKSISTLGEPSILGDFLDLPGKPDGMALAPDGTFWVAMWGGGSVVQLAPDGTVLVTVVLPAPNPSSLCFAGPERLFVTTSRARLSPSILDRYPQSGGLFEVQLTGGRR